MMGLRLLSYFEEGSRILAYDQIDRHITYYGAEPVLVDVAGDWAGYRGAFPLIYSSCAEARAAMSDWTWVFLHQDATSILDEFDHPSEGNVVYAVGGNSVGFCGHTFEELQQAGTCLRLRKEEAINDYQVVAQVLYDRMLKLIGRRL